MAKKNNNRSAIRKESDNNVPRLNRAIYSSVDATYGYPTGLAVPAVGVGAGIAMFNPNNMWYEVTDSVADAAWRKRLGLSYDDKFLIENKDGSYRLPKNIEREIPTDTTFIKRRIADNEKLANQDNILGDDYKLVQGMIKLDKETLNALRHTYKTGEPVVLNEFSNNSRTLAKEGAIPKESHSYKSPLNVLRNYTVRYNPRNKTMEYMDTYDFNDFEGLVPGEPFDIKGEIPLKKYGIGGFFNNSLYKLDKWNSKVSDKLFNSQFGQGLEKLGIKNSNIGGITNTAATAIGGLVAGKNTTGVGKAMQGIGSLASNIPGVGGLIGAGVNLAGGLVNATFGSNLNQEFIDQTEQAAKQTANYVSNASTNAQLMSDYANMSLLADINKKDVGTEGWLSNKATDETERLNKLTDEANAKALASIERTAENIDKQNDLGLMANYVAYGGPLNIFKDGGIYIKPSHRGRLTELKARTGKTEAELYNDGNPAHKKMVVFARNARKWKHDEGGPLDTRMELLNKLKERRNKKGVYNGGEFGGAGASSLFLESPDDYTLVKDTVWIPYRETFNQAFDKASKAGLETFMFDNKLYTTELGDNPDNNRAGEERFIEGLLPVERTKKVKNVKAEGGDLFTNGITTIGNGGTHEENPYEGVQMGVDTQGVPNLVEEGEVIYNDYVYSNRLRVPKEVRQKYKLRGVTFADAVKQLQKESKERPNDPISDNTLNAIMSELQQEQEMIRMKKNSNKYAKGGKLGRLYEGEGGDSNWLYKPITPGFTPSKVDIIAEMEQTYPSLLSSPELTQKDREMLGRDLLDYNNKTAKVAPMKNHWLRYTPIFGAGISVLNDWLGGNEPDYGNADMYQRAIEGTNKPITFTPSADYLAYKPVDIERYKNRLDANASAGRSAIRNTSGGNRAAYLTGLLASDYNYGNQLGELMGNIEGINYSRYKDMKAYNKATNLANAEMAMRADMANAEQGMQRARMYGSLAEYRDAIRAKNRAEKSANLTNLLQGMGDLGRELTDRDKLRWLADRGVLAYNPSGEYTGKETTKKGKKYGGKLNKKRGGFTV